MELPSLRFRSLLFLSNLDNYASLLLSLQMECCSELGHQQGLCH